MNLYLVRHGRTIDNEEGKVAPLTSPLSQHGRVQAETIASRLKNISFDNIYSSDLSRTIDTASSIAKQHDMKINKTPLLREHKKPSEIEGLGHESEEAQRVYRLMEENMEDFAWHYSDEENYYDFRGRLIQFLEEMEKQKGENVLAVTHSLVIRLLVCIVLLGKDMSASEFHKARWNMKAANTGVTVLEHKESKWSLITFNDIAHLAE